MLLEKNQANFTPLSDYEEIKRILSANAQSVANAINKTPEESANALLGQVERVKKADRSKGFFERALKLGLLRTRWANVSTEFAFLRKLSLPAVDAALESVQSTLQSLKSAKTEEAYLKYARVFDEQYGRVSWLVVSYESVTPFYRKAALSIVNASRIVSESVKKGVVLPEKGIEAQRRLKALEYTLIYAEARLVEGRPPFKDAAALLEGISANATVIVKAARERPPDQTLLYATVTGGVALALAAVAWRYRRKWLARASGLESKAKEELSERINKVIEKIREIEKL